MRWKNNADAYGAVAKSLHWLMALLIIGLLAVGLYMTDQKITPDILKLYGLHKATGMLVLALVCARFSWRMLNAPPALDPMPRIMRFGAHAVHYALYACMFLLPLSGWAMSSAAGFPVSFYGLFTVPVLLAPDRALQEVFSMAHTFIAYGLMGLIAVHAAAALYHHFVRKDATLRRMLPVVALLCMSVSMPGFAEEAKKEAEKKPVAAAPVYTVIPEKSTLGFTAMQNGAPVEGEFKHFTADIRFDPEHLEASSVVVEVDMSSVASAHAEMAPTLLGAEWFDAARFPKAVFRTVALKAIPGRNNRAQGYYGDATLTLRDKTMTVSPNFTIEEAGGETIATGTVPLLRTQFGVGQGEWKKTDAVRDNVTVHFRIVAVKR